VGVVTGIGIGIVASIMDGTASRCSEERLSSVPIWRRVQPRHTSRPPAQRRPTLVGQPVGDYLDVARTVTPSEEPSADLRESMSGLAFGYIEDNPPVRQNAGTATISCLYGQPG
jgi:hypothetical protein